MTLAIVGHQGGFAVQSIECAEQRAHAGVLLIALSEKGRASQTFDTEERALGDVVLRGG
jgi:hypothetical protein